MQILHLSADFPDPLAPAKTRAIANLLEITPEFEHLVYSLNRVGWRHRIAALEFGPGWRALTYGAPPMGLGMVRYLDRVAEYISADIARRGLDPAILHAHKLSVEGLIGARLAAELDKPLAVSVQGNSDLKIIRAKRDLRARYRGIWRGAQVVFPFAPWASAALSKVLGPREGRMQILPCPTPEDRILPPTRCGPILRTAFNLGAHRIKNAPRLIEAVARAASQVPDLSLEIVGGGDPEGFARLSALADARAPDRIRFAGPVSHVEMQPLLNLSGGLAMPSRRESYGMVFAEALLAGCPILHSKGNGFDGYLPEGEVSLAVAHNDSRAIAEGLVRLARDEEGFKARLAAMQSSGRLAEFQRSRIAEKYRSAMRDAATLDGPC